MPHIDRITRMEKALDTVSAAVKNFSEAANAYAEAQSQLEALSAYFGSEAWLQDLADDESGLLPLDLKRGVLSQDAVYDLLCDNEALIELLRELLQNLESKKTAPDHI